jgi:hypothetical protein
VSHEPTPDEWRSALASFHPFGTTAGLKAAIIAANALRDAAWERELEAERKARELAEYREHQAERTMTETLMARADGLERTDKNENGT